jgi:transketolase
MSAGVAVSREDAWYADAQAADRLAIDTIRCLAMDAVQAANSGHPGLPMAMAPVAYVLYTRFMRYDPAEPKWPDRDRFVLSAGHGSMLLYATLHLAGYDLGLDELKAFRQWGSRTPGHPEVGLTPGVETTTGPLGQGFANGVGMAIAERFLRHRYGSDVMDHRVFAICSDGDLMEGVSAEAASLAGHLGLGRLVYVYDDNGITIDGSTALSFAREDVDARFRAYGWHVQSVADANDLVALTEAVDQAIAEPDRPSLIRVQSVIGYPAPNKQGTAAAHGAELGDDEVRAAKRALGRDPEAKFVVPDAAYAAFAVARAEGANAHERWRQRFARWSGDHPALAAEWERAWRGEPEPGVVDALGDPGSGGYEPGNKPKLATRAAGGRLMRAFGPHLPTMLGGAADLLESTKTVIGDCSFTATDSGPNVHWGVREHAMGAAVNGMALHGGIVKPFGSTFLVFSDYMRPAIRLSALMRLPVVWVFTHDSVAVGEDGPTHQPIEHYAALRAIPGLTVIRPADANEAVGAWRVALAARSGPVALLLTRQDLPVLDPERVGDRVARGAYILQDPPREPDVVLVASGSEVTVALQAAELLNHDAIGARVVSMPSWELFEAQDAGYRRWVLPATVPAVSVEAGIAQGWSRYVQASVSIERFGASAPGGRVLTELGITAERVATVAREIIGARSSG